MTLNEERLKLCTLMDKCDGCTLPPEFGNVTNHTTLRHNWCMNHCPVPSEMRAQLKRIEDMQRMDRKRRGVIPAPDVSVLFLEDCK